MSHFSEPEDKELDPYVCECGYKTLFSALLEKHKAKSCGLVLSPVIKITSELLSGFRALRLYHWQKTLHFSAKVNGRSPGANRVQTASYKTQYNFHLKQVQLLNEFFPIGDSAEKDFLK